MNFRWGMRKRKDNSRILILEEVKICCLRLGTQSKLPPSQTLSFNVFRKIFKVNKQAL